MKNILPCFVLVALLVACGDHAGDFSADYLDSNPVQIGDESQDKDSVDVEVVASEEDIPNCTSTREGGVFYVAELEQKFVCRDGEWVEYEPDSDEGEECGEDECEASEKSSSSKRRRSSSSTEDEEDDGDGDFEEDEDNDESSDSGEDPASSSSREKGKSSSSAVSPTGAIGGICVASDSVIEKGESVQWSYKRIGPVIPSTYSWTFEDGSIASSQDSLPAPVTYVTAGIHGVTLVLDKGKEHEELRTCSVRVHGTPVTSCECTNNATNGYVVLPDDEEATVTWSVSGCEGAAPFTYSWGGVAAGTSTSSTVAFSTTGNFAPTVNISNSEYESVSLTCPSVKVAGLKSTCTMQKTTTGSVSATRLVATPSQSLRFNIGTMVDWPTGVSSLSMTLEGGGSSIGRAVSSSSNTYTSLTAPSIPGTYYYSLVYSGRTVCTDTLVVEYPQITATCMFSSVLYTQSPVESVDAGTIVYFSPSGFSSDWTSDMPYSLTMSIAGKSTTGADSAWNVSVNKSYNSGFSVKVPKVSGNYTYKLMYYDSEVCSADLTVVGSSSSSSVIASSSSANESSSSEAVAEVKSAGYYENHCPAGHNCRDAAPSTYLKSGITYGEILDTRDDQVYKVVTIGDQTWMAQNLNYAYNVRTSSLDSSSFCYNGKADSCAKYGRLYTWAAAIDSVALANDADDPQTCGYGETCTLPTVVQGICPSGWHLPTYAEWDTLFTNVGGENVAGRMLKSEEGWNYSESTKGIDYYGFSALPAGDRNHNGYFLNAGYYALFWSSSESSSVYAYGMYLFYDYESAGLVYNTKYLAFSVRCLQN